MFESRVSRRWALVTPDALPVWCCKNRSESFTRRPHCLFVLVIFTHWWLWSDLNYSWNLPKSVVQMLSLLLRFPYTIILMLYVSILIFVMQKCLLLCYFVYFKCIFVLQFVYCITLFIIITEQQYGIFAT